MSAREARGVEVMCTPWDRPSVDALVGYGLPALKIASADLTNHDLVSYAAATGVPLILSTGMSSEEEIVETARLVRESGTPFVMLHCQSTYPAPFKDVNLRYMARIGELAGCLVGYSGHERGFHVPLAAVALGASVIEKHVTVDRGMEGNDHKVSLLPDELTAMVRQTRELEEAMGSAAPRACASQPASAASATSGGRSSQSTRPSLPSQRRAVSVKRCLGSALEGRKQNFRPAGKIPASHCSVCSFSGRLSGPPRESHGQVTGR